MGTEGRGQEREMFHRKLQRPKLQLESHACCSACRALPVWCTVVALGFVKNYILQIQFVNEILFLITVGICFFVVVSLYTLDEIQFNWNNNSQYTFSSS